MHMLIITFQLDGMTVQEFHELCDQIAPTWADIPGLVSKVWLENPEINTYGGIYTWQSRQAMEQFLNSDLFDAVATNPNFTNASVQDYGVIAAPTQVTRGMQTVLA